MWLVMKQFEYLAANCSTLWDQRRKMPGYLGLRVQWHVVIFYSHQMNRVNSCNSCAMMMAP